jgi:hypothetical protein
VEGIFRENANGVLRLYKKPVVTIFVRHSGVCRSARHGAFFRGCDCPKWLRYSLGGKQFREAADTRSWTVAEEKRTERQKQLDNPHQLVSAPSSTEQQRTIAQHIESFIADKQTNNVGPDFMMALRSQLTRLEQFFAVRGQFYPANLTKHGVSEFRSSWATSWQRWRGWGPLKRSKAQTNYRAFLKYCGRTDLLDTFTKIKYGQSKPKPLTKEQVRKLLSQISATFADAEKAKRVAVFVKTAISLGPACIDVVALEREAVQKATNGVVRFERHKTGRIATPRVDAMLRKELLALDNNGSLYLFWDGKGLLDTAVKAWADDVRRLFKGAGLYVKGDLTHRFRDTAIDFWFSEGCNSTEVADMAGDTVAIIEKHYKDYCSKARESHIAKLPARSWEATGV